MDDTEDQEPSLDTLSRAFAKAMGQQKPVEETTSASEPDAESTPVEAALEPLSVTKKEKPPTPVVDPCPISPKSILEAILFVGHPENESISAERVASLLRGVDAEEVKTLVDQLNEEYQQLDMPFAIQLVDGGFCIELKTEFEHLHDRFYGRVREAQLSQLAIDILAVVAYHQPLTREELDKKLNSTQPTQRVLNQLVRRDLLERRTTTDKPKRREYITTDRFLDLFNLDQISDLPRSETPE